MLLYLVRIERSGREVGVLSVGVVLLILALTALRGLLGLIHWVIESHRQQRVEKERQLSLAAMLVVMPEVSVVVQQHPDGTTCLLARGMVTPGRTEAPR
jgi:hypothetical protein